MTATKAIALNNVSLDDKYELSQGRIYLQGMHALARLLIEQRQRDIAADLNTAGFVSGYRGSPLGNLDNVLWKEEARLLEHDVHFKPGLNEDLAATSLWGTQQVGLFGEAKVDGVFGLWYGKGPGVDRSLDVLKHANLAGTSPYGGVLAVAGDDHISQSSTLAHQSDQTFIAAMIPVLNPSSVQEYLDFGIIGYAMSRYSGCWIGFKALAETVESSASITVDPARLVINDPEDFEAPFGGLHIRWPDPPLAAETRLHGFKMQAVAAFARANRIDRVTIDPKEPRLGIITTGKSYLDVRQALIELGIAERAEELGVRVYKVGLSWPLEVEGARSFAQGLREILVVEEKQGLIESQLTRILYNMDASDRPRIVGKTDESGAPLLPSDGQLGAAEVARAIFQRLRAMGFDEPSAEQRVARLESFDLRNIAPGGSQLRTPFFCSGCPHSTSTKLPEGSRAHGGIGCHGMATMIPELRTETLTHMGGEGANWIGQAPFSKDNHVFQNLGDGTYAHSGLMAIRAAIAAGVNITYKILYNDAVAMTGGQPAEGQFTVAQITQQVAAEGATKIVVVTDELDRHTNAEFAEGTDIFHRDSLDEVQRMLRDIPGTTILVYEQTCAAEKRRRRKRGLLADPARRVFINEAVCEGCGDCSDASNCVSIVPLETELGRKRAIDQSSCNKDYSCIKGFCPSFVVVEGGNWRGKNAAKNRIPRTAPEVPMPASRALNEPYNILVAGIGGTGVVTIGALLGMAAHLEGRGCTVSDFTGLSQKGGSVTSHVRLAESPEDLHSVRIAPGGAHLLLAYDQVVATGSDILSRLEGGVSHAVINRYIAPTAAFISEPDIDFEQARLGKRLRDLLGPDGADFIDATGRATALTGDAIASNLFLLGFAFQKGLIPLSFEALDRAIELNGAAVAMNRLAFAWGRTQAHDPDKLSEILGLDDKPEASEDVDTVILRRRAMLVAYQDETYAQRYERTLRLVRAREHQVAPKSIELTMAVAKCLYKLMAYKDEYEVARLYTDTGFLESIAEQFEGRHRIKFSFAPPLFAKRNPATGRLRKHLFGSWMYPALRLLAYGKRLRGTKLDPFGYLADRKLERSLIDDFEALVAELVNGLSRDNLPLATRIAGLSMGIKGYGHVKDRNLAKVKKEEARLMKDFRNDGHLRRAA